MALLASCRPVPKADILQHAKCQKRQETHVVPLSDRSVSILKALSRTGDHVFINGGGRSISNVAMAELVKGMGVGVTVHGFRSTFRTWADERTTYDHYTKETALAHVTHQSKVEQAYNRSDALQRRRRLMDEWSRYCERQGVACGEVLLFALRALLTASGLATTKWRPGLLAAGDK